MAFTFKHGDQPLEGYTVQRGVGRGGFGEVYFALSDSGKEVALKYLRDNPQIELRGVSHCLNLKSPYLVTLYDVRQNADDEHFVIMEYVSGPTLRDVMNDTDGPLGPQKAAFFIREIAKGLTYLHDHGIVHRDMKPGNIFYEDGYVKIGDYGLSKFISPSQHSAQTMSVGTVHYMAPEIGSGSYGPWTDIYALGVMLYEMLVGQVPFVGSSMAEILMKHLTAQPEVDALPAPFPAVIRKALAKDPKDRYASVADMVADLFGQEDIERSVAGFDAASLSTIAHRAYAGVPQSQPAGVRGSSQVEPFAQPPTPAPLPPARPYAPQLDPASALRGRSQRITMTALVTGGLCCAAALLGNAGGASFPAMIAALVVLGSITFGSLVGTLYAAPRVQFGNKWGERLLVVACAAPPMLLLHSGIGELGYPLGAVGRGLSALIFVGLVPAVLFTLFFCDWPGRVRSGLRGQVDFGAAVRIGIFGLIVGALCDIPALMFAGIVAAASLAVQASASIWADPRSLLPRDRAAAAATGSSLAAAPFDPRHTPGAAHVAGPHAPVGPPSASEGAPHRMPPRSPAHGSPNKGAAFGLRMAAAGCLVGAMVTFTIAADAWPRAEAASLIGASGCCLLFAILFGFESWKAGRGHATAAARFGKRCATTGFLAGAFMLFCLALSQRGDDAAVFAAVAGGCLVFALVFQAEWVKAQLVHPGRAVRYAVGPVLAFVGAPLFVGSLHPGGEAIGIPGFVMMMTGLAITAVAVGRFLWRRRAATKAAVQHYHAKLASQALDSGAMIERTPAERIAWRLAAAALFVAAVISFATIPFDVVTRDDEVAVVLCLCFGSLLAMGFALLQSRRYRPASLWLKTIRPLLLIAFPLMAVISVVCMTFVASEQEHLLACFGFLVAAIVFGVTVFLLRGDPATASLAQSPSAPPPHAGVQNRIDNDETIALKR